MHLDNHSYCSKRSTNNISSDIECASYLSDLEACLSFTKPLVKPNGSKSNKKQKVGEKVDQVERNFGCEKAHR